MSQQLQQLIDAVSAAAPSLWAIYIRQSIAYAYLDLAVGIPIAIVILVIAWLVFKHARQLADEDDDNSESWMFMAAILCVFGLVILLTNLSMAVMRLSNPGFYAIQLLIESAHQAVGK